jgi:hypothetical protein
LPERLFYHIVAAGDALCVERDRLVGSCGSNITGTDKAIKGRQSGGAFDKRRNWDPAVSFCGHKHRSRRRDHHRGTTMRAQRSWKPVGPFKHDAEIERLHLELAAFNKRIDELEKLHPESSTIEALKASALVLSRKIDELRCSGATDDLTGLLAK